MTTELRQVQNQGRPGAIKRFSKSFSMLRCVSNLGGALTSGLKVLNVDAACQALSMLRPNSAASKSQIW